MLDDLRGEKGVVGYSLREGMSNCTYYKWSKGFYESDKKSLAAVSIDQIQMTCERGAATRKLKESVAELILRSDLRRGAFFIRQHSRNFRKKRG